jgi:hypothetical protein
MAKLGTEAIGGAIKGIAGIAGGLIGGRKRRREQAAAQRELDAAKSSFAAIDTSNPYKNVTNTFEDLTVNTQAADFAAQQQNQGLANIMGGLAGSAGGGGVAALAQSLANQQSASAQQAAASIGAQESQNQKLAAQGEQQAQMQRAQGEALSRQMQFKKSEKQMDMAQTRLESAKAARAAATSSIMGGIGSIAGAGIAAGKEGGLGLGIQDLLGGEG